MEGKVRQSVIGTLGRRDLLANSDTLPGLMASLGKFTRHAAVLAKHRSGKTEVLWRRSLGPGLVYTRLWEELGLPEVLAQALRERKFGFAVERAIVLPVLHRLLGSGGRSDRAAEQWREGRPICCELWPGNTTDVTTLLPVVRRLRERFGIQQVCIVSDRGMISDATVATLEDQLPGVTAAQRGRGGAKCLSLMRVPGPPILPCSELSGFLLHFWRLSVC